MHNIRPAIKLPGETDYKPFEVTYMKDKSILAIVFKKTPAYIAKQIAKHSIFGIADKPILKYCDYSETIRQWPQNYMVASYHNKQWIVRPDMAVDIEVATKVFRYFHSWEVQYNTPVSQIINDLNKIAFNSKNK